jgi:hypothetical protein
MLRKPSGRIKQAWKLNLLMQERCFRRWTLPANSQGKEGVEIYEQDERKKDDEAL